MSVLNELLKAKAEITPKEKLFLRYYRKSGNAAWSAERAGYGDPTEGGRILDKPAVRGYLACQTLDRSAHRPVTYRDMIFLHERGMETVRAVWKDPDSTLRDKAIALEVAGKAAERVAKVEGLLKQDQNVTVGIGYDGSNGGLNGNGTNVNVQLVNMDRLNLEELKQYRDLMQKLAAEGDNGQNGTGTEDDGAGPMRMIEAECRVVEPATTREETVEVKSGPGETAAAEVEKEAETADVGGGNSNP